MSNLTEGVDHPSQFSNLPIQGAMSPLSRDSNTLPLSAEDVQLEDTDVAERHPPPANHLTTVNMDVQNHIMSYLPTPDLSALMRTCRYFLDTVLCSLCARIPEQMFEHLAQVVSFYKFLRPNAGPLSRGHLVKHLRFRLPYDPSYHRDGRDPKLRAQDIDAFLGILRSCRHLPRLQIDRWFKAIPTSFLLHTLGTSLPDLEELSLNIAGRPDTEEKDLLKLGRLTKVRRIAMTASHATTLQSLQPVASAMVELDLMRVPYDGNFAVPAGFVNVQKLDMSTDRDPAWLKNVAATFPNVSELVLRSRFDRCRRHRCSTGTGRAQDDSLHYSNTLLWQSPERKIWPTLRAIWTNDLCGLYCLGVSRHVPAISVPYDRMPQTHYFLPMVLAEVRPVCVELRVRLHTHPYVPQILFATGLLGGSGVRAVPCVTLSLDLINQEGQFRDDRSFFELFACELPEMSLTHVLVRYHVQHNPLVTEVATTVAAHALENATYLAQSSPTLRWIGFDIRGLGLLCWAVLRPSESLSGGDADTSSDFASEETPHLVTLTPMSEREGRRIVEVKKMDTFAAICPSSIL